MDLEQFKVQVPDYVLGKLSISERTRMERYSDVHPEAKAFIETYEFLAVENELPSASMDRKFYTFLEEQTKVETFATSKPVIGFRKLKPFLFASAAVIVLLVGFFVGQQWNIPTVNESSTIVTHEALEQATQETDDVRTQLVISLADQPLATKRLEAVSEVSKLNKATDKVITALFKMLNSDSNVNVRLAAVTSLSNYVDNPKVREGLVMSITKQESPLVQIALAELMVTLKEQKSINSMETLLQQPNINEAVKQKLEESIKQII